MSITLEYLYQSFLKCLTSKVKKNHIELFHMYIYKERELSFYMNEMQAFTTQYQLYILKQKQSAYGKLHYSCWKSWVEIKKCFLGKIKLCIVCDTWCSKPIFLCLYVHKHDNLRINLTLNTHFFLWLPRFRQKLLLWNNDIFVI